MQAHSLLSMDPYTLSLGQTRLILVQYNLGFFALNPRTFIYSFIFLNFFCLYLLSIIIFYFIFIFFFFLSSLKKKKKTHMWKRRGAKLEYEREKKK